MLTGLKVYISSTSVDLAEFRTAVISSLRKSGFYPVCMEDYVAQDRLPVEKCLADVAASDLYVGIFAWRYGFVPPGFDKSITELEYRKAVETAIPTLLFLLDESADWPTEFCDTRQDAARISDFREELKLGKMIGWFTPDPHQLASAVQAAATHAEREIHRVQRDKLEKLLSERYAEISIADTPEQKVSLEQALTLVQEAMRQQALNAQQTTRDPIPIQLPKLRGTFVDREIERDTLFHCLRRTDKSLVVIVAPGGYGKTELTTKVLKEVAPGSSIVTDDIQGILYVRCIRGDVSVGQIFAEAGRIAGKKQEFCDKYAEKEITFARKLEYFFSELSRAGNVWLVMDNFEDLLTPDDDSIRDDELREFLETAVAIEHNVKMIVTSRAVPRFKGSRSAEKIDLSAGLPPDQAIRYLREEGGEYGLRDESDEVLREFVLRVHCIPKALESVLGFLEDHYPGITIRDIVSDENLFVDFDRHDLEKGLKGLVAQQFSRLPADAQLLLSVISIFSKPVSSAALRYMLQGLGSAEFSAILTRLEKNRLVSQTNCFYELHPMVKSFVYGRIPETSECNAMNNENDRSSSIFTRSWLHGKAAEFFSILRKPIEQWRNIDDIDPQLQETHHLICAGQYDLASQVLYTIDESYLSPWGHYELIVDIRKRLLGKINDIKLQAYNFGRLGNVYNALSRFQLSIDASKMAISASKDINDKLSESKWLSQIGVNFHYLGDYHSSIEYQKQALALSSEIGNAYAEANSLDNIGYSYRSIACYEDSICYHRQALELYRKLGEKNEEAKCLNYLGEALRHTGNYSLALEHFQLAFDIAQKSGHRRLMTSCLNKLGTIVSVYGDKYHAIEYFTNALQIAREIGDSREEGIQLGYFGDMYVDLGENEKAIAYYQQALLIMKEIKSLVWEGRFLSGIGNAYIALTNYVRAEEYLLLSLDIVTNIQNKNRQLYTETKLAELYLLINKLEYAMDIIRHIHKYKAMGYYHRAILLKAIINARYGLLNDAKESIEEAVNVANQTLSKSPKYYSAYYSRGLAYSIQSIITVDGDPLIDLRRSKEDFGTAVANCSANGIIQDSIRLLKTLIPMKKAEETIVYIRPVLTK